MLKRIQLCVLLVATFVWMPSAITPCAQAQTLGGITGTVSDSSGSVLPDTTILLVGDQTQLTRLQKTTPTGSYDFVNLPIGTYTLNFTHEGFQSERIPSITVQADRTATVNATLKVGQVGSVVTVEATPLMNAVDTTNGYILEKDQIDAVPLPTGSFTGLAILSPGVNAELGVEPAQTLGWAISPSGLTASAIQATASFLTASTPATCSTGKAPARWPRRASSITPAWPMPPAPAPPPSKVRPRFTWP